MQKLALIVLIICTVPLLAPKCGGPKKEKAAQEVETAAKPEPLRAVPFADKASDQKDNYPDSLMVRFQRNACFGTCPVDITEIYKSGLVVYTPRANGLTEVPSAAQIDKAELIKILGAAEKIDYWNLPNEYDAYIPDLPGSRVYLKSDDQAKEIDVKSGSPEELRPLAKAIINALTTVENWDALPTE